MQSVMPAFCMIEGVRQKWHLQMRECLQSIQVLQLGKILCPRKKKKTNSKNKTKQPQNHKLKTQTNHYPTTSPALFLIISTFKSNSYEHGTVKYNFTAAELKEQKTCFLEAVSIYLQALFYTQELRTVVINWRKISVPIFPVTHYQRYVCTSRRHFTFLLWPSGVWKHTQRKTESSSLNPRTTEMGRGLGLRLIYHLARSQVNDMHLQASQAA